MKTMNILCTLLCTMLLAVLPATAQNTDDNKNKAIIETTNGSHELNTDEISVIRFDGGKITVVQPWGETFFDRTLRSLSFLRPNPNTVRLTATTSIGTEGGSNRAQTIDGGKLKSTWESGDKVYVYTDENTTTSIGTLTPNSYGSNVATLSGDIDTEGLYTGKTLYFSTQPRPYDFSSQDGRVESLFYFTATGTITIDNANASISNLNFSRPFAVVKFTLKDKATSDAISATQLTVTTGATTITVTPSSSTGELYVGIPGISEQAVSLSANITPCYVYSYEKASASFTNNYYYAINVKMTKQYVDLSRVTSDFTAVDGDELRGTLGENHKISIASGAEVTLSGVNINGSGTWTSGNYAGINCLGDATIILKDGTTNAVKGFYGNYPGIHVPSGSTLTLQGTGTLNASSNGYGAGIGGGFNFDCGNIIIKSGTVTAIGGTDAAGIGAGENSSCNTITIDGGIVTATGGGWGAGIGSGYKSSCGAICINGGTVGATGGGYGSAGIGSGCEKASCGAISINGGMVTAMSGQDAAAIGSGASSSCGTITISDGIVIANGASGRAGIGTGAGAGTSCETITISGGTVTAIGGSGSAGIGCGVNTTTCVAINITGGSVTATGGNYGAGIGSGYDHTNCGAISISGGTVNATGGEYAAGIGCGVYESSCGDITIENTVTRVTATKGSGATNSIGNGSDGTCGTVTIGGVVGAISTSPYTYEPLPKGTLSGKFTINAGGDQVRFSQGNLQATTTDLGANWTWSFTTNQWDYIGGRSGGSEPETGNNFINGNGTMSANGTVDLFGWVGSSNTTWTGAAQYGISNSTHEDEYDYGTNNTDVLKSDWGTLAITNGGNTANSGWRTLTTDEWQYVINSNGEEDKRRVYVGSEYKHPYGRGNVMGVNGLILLPDTWDGSVDYGFSYGTSDWPNVYTEETPVKWSDMEAAGAVFLPAAGRRVGTGVYGVEYAGYYWSSTTYNSPYQNGHVFHMCFLDYNMSADWSYERYNGSSVRLVKDVE